MPSDRKGTGSPPKARGKNSAHSKSRKARSRSAAAPKNQKIVVQEMSLDHILADLRKPPSKKEVKIKIGNFDMHRKKALEAAKALEKSADRTLPEAVELAKTRESFHRELGGKFRLLSGETVVK